MRIVPLPAFSDNYIWAVVRGRRCAVVDPGDAAPVEAFLARESLALDAILITHHHADHIGGVAALLAHHACMVVAPHDARCAPATRRVASGDCVTLEGQDDAPCRFTVIAVPGHTTGHVAYAGEGLLFCGDTLFGAGCGRLFEGTPAQMAASLARLAALPPDTAVCCAHEYTLANLRFAAAVEPANPAVAARQRDTQALRDAGQPSLPTTLALERATNPFLRTDQPAVRAAAERFAGAPLGDASEVFAALRRWKDGFRG